MLYKSYRLLISPNEIVAQRRRELCLTQTDLSKLMGYATASFVNMIENKKSTVPLDRAADFARVLEMDARWFTLLVLRDLHPKVADLLAA